MYYCIHYKYILFVITYYKYIHYELYLLFVFNVIVENAFQGFSRFNLSRVANIKLVQTPYKQDRWDLNKKLNLWHTG